MPIPKIILILNLLTAQGAQAASGTKQSPVVSADIPGDWREEATFRVGNQALRVYMTTALTRKRIYSVLSAGERR